MKDFFVFSFLSALLILPLSPVLSAVGISVCPIMRQHGFIFGCDINFNFTMGLFFWNLLLGNVVILINKSLIKFSILKVEKSVVLSSIFFCSSFAGLLFLYSSAVSSIANAGSPYSAQISAILFSFGIAVVFIQTALADFISMKNLGTVTSEASVSTTIFWNNFLANGAPLFVLCGFFYFMASLLDAQVEGWSTLSDQKPRFYWGALIFICWYLAFHSLLKLGKTRILKRLELQANSLKMPESKQKMSLARTAELKFVAQALNNARDVINERTHLLSNFSRFVSDRLIEQVVKSEELSLEGRNTKAVIIMTDLRDFTSISQHLNPNDIVKMLNIYFDSMIQVLHRHEIIVDKFIGDGLLAYRADTANEIGTESCMKALQASLQMILALKETNKILKSNNLPQLKIGVGIHYGDVVLGAMGSKSRMQYTIIGDSVNRAARIESLCKELSTNLIISETVYNNCSTDFKKLFEGPFAQQIKGIAEPANVYKCVT